MRFWFLRWFLVRNGYLSGLDIVSTFFNLKKDSFPIFKESPKRNLPNLKFQKLKDISPALYIG